MREFYPGSATAAHDLEAARHEEAWERADPGWYAKKEATMGQEIVRVEPLALETAAMSVEGIKAQVALIQNVMADVMQEGEHYGTIPGCDKPSLLQPGAEKLGLTFRLAPEFSIETSDLGKGHREHRVTCSLTHIPTGQRIGQGVGSCSTMESKYRYRNDSDFEVTGDPIPKDAKERKREYRKQGFGMRKVESVWEWVRYKEERKVENPDIADTYNTVLKMAKKRAHVDAIKSATAASDIFTQDVEDMDLPAPAEAPAPKREPRKAAPRKAKTPDEVAESMGGEVVEEPQQKSFAGYDATGDTRPVTEAQLRRLFALQKKAGALDSDMSALVRYAGGAERAKDLTREGIQKVFEVIEECSDRDAVIVRIDALMMAAQNTWPDDVPF